jgi:predicted transcriptional regulator
VDLDCSTSCKEDHKLPIMGLIRRTIDLDPETDARLRAMAVERGQDEGKVIAEAVALLDSVVDIAGPDIAEDRRRLDAFRRSRKAVPLSAVKAWVESWGTAKELPPPKSQTIE